MYQYTLRHTYKTQDFLNMESAYKYEMWELLRHEKFLEIHVLATLLTGNALLFNGKKTSCIFIRYQQVISECPDFWRYVSHRFNGKFTLNLCDTQVFKTKNSEISWVCNVCHLSYKTSPCKTLSKLDCPN